MVDITRIRTAISLIAQGLYDKQNQLKKDPSHYPYSGLLHRGCNMFLAEKYKSFLKRSESNEEKYESLSQEELQTIFQYGNITSFAEHYLTKEISEWFNDWPASAQAELKLKSPTLFCLPNLAETDPHFGYSCTESCLDLIDSLERKDIIGAIEQRTVYDELKKMNQEDYIDTRRFIIENQTISKIDRMAFFESHNNNQFVLNAVDNAYQKVDDEYFTRKYGVEKYIAQPGIYEIQLEEYCKSLGLECQLWPGRDNYDLKIVFPNKTIWVIDVKAYKDATNLAWKLEGLEIDKFSLQDDNTKSFSEGFIIIPNDIFKNGASRYTKKDYISLINKTLNRVSPGNQTFGIDFPYWQCLTISDIKKLIKEEAAKR